MKNRTLREIAAVFFKLGCIAFGGPAAHIAMMDEEIVQKRKWMSRSHFLDLIGATQLIPGPNSTEMTMHCGHERGGVWGLLIAGVCFITPAVIITGILAYFYVEYGHTDVLQPWVYGIKAAVLSIIGAAILKLGKKALRNQWMVLIAVLVFSLALLGFHEVYLMLVAGILGAVFLFFFQKRDQSTALLLPLSLTGVSTTTLGSLQIFITFLKVGSILYGSGYVLFAYLDAELVDPGLLSRTELVEAIAIGQFTPGPVLSTATFIGYQLGGWSGAVAATLGIFLPSFLFVWMLNPLIPKMRQSRFLGLLLDTVSAAAVAVMAAVLVEMSLEVLLDLRSMTIAILSFFLVLSKWKVSSVYIVVLGSLLGRILLLI